MEETLEFFSTTEMWGNVSTALMAVAAHQKAKSHEDKVVEKKEEWRKGYKEFATHIGRGAWTLESSTRRRQTFPMKSITNPSIEQLATYLLPTIRIPCAHCDGILPPHNSGYEGLAEDLPSYNLGDYKNPIQVFAVPYECQNCHNGEPLIFLLRREGMKITLVGRSHFEKPHVPPSIPKNVSQFHRDAVIARQCNQVLSGLFQLRTLVEQHMRSSIETPSLKLTGDELAELYAKKLPTSFSQNFPSFKKIYHDLSVAIHSANADEDLFDSVLPEIETHFEALLVFRKHAANGQTSKPPQS